MYLVRIFRSSACNEMKKKTNLTAIFTNNDLLLINTLDY